MDLMGGQMVAGLSMTLDEVGWLVVVGGVGVCIWTFLSEGIESHSPQPFSHSIMN